MSNPSNKPRQTPDRDSRYMGLAWVHASFSKDPNTQVGAVVVTGDNYLIGSGYNGPPRGMDDDELDWGRPAKNDWIIHAEANSIRYAQGNVAGATIYVTAPPCKGCILEAASVGISRIVYFVHKVIDPNSYMADQDAWGKVVKIATAGNVKLEPFAGSLAWMQTRMGELEQLGVFGLPANT